MTEQNQGKIRKKSTLFHLLSIETVIGRKDKQDNIKKLKDNTIFHRT
jgi:hypothetical protein